MAYTDTELQRIAQEQLAWDSRLGDSNLQVTVLDGEVTLYGTVSSHFAKESAEADILEIPGVTKVKNQSNIAIPNSETIPDFEIKTRILNRLFWNPNIQSSSINIMVHHGVVVISGEIDEYWKKIRIEELVFDIDGVLEVHNELVVVPRHPYSDKEITSNIIAALNRNPKIDYGNVQIEVDNGTVRFTGTVSEIRQINSIYEIARFTRGVRDVINLLRVYKKVA